MKTLLAACGLAVLTVAAGVPALWAEGQAEPVTPDASPEARALLQVLYDISGKYTLTGQHNYPNVQGRDSEFAAKYTGRTPVIWGCDMGFAKPGDNDSYLARPDIVREAIEQNRRGSIIALCWHAVPPTADEPVTFQPVPGSHPPALASVQGRLTDEQFRDILTPGTALYQHWCEQVDEVAATLKQLQDAHVPVLWRAYHEMNGSWFWWGGRYQGKYTTAALYRQIFDRFVHYHHLNNLIWVWSMDRVHSPEMEHAKYFPGIQYVDVLAMDIYGNDWAQSYYDSLVHLSQGKPITLAEVGDPPPPAVLDRQPLWTYYMIWAGMVRNTTRRQYEAIYRDPRYLYLEDPAYWNAIEPYRQVAGFPPLHIEPRPADFSGTWVLDEDKSQFGQMGPGFLPAKLEITDSGGALAIRSTRIVEWGPDQVTKQDLRLDGSESVSAFGRFPQTTTARRSPDGQSLAMEISASAPWLAPGAKMVTHDTWTLGDEGQALIIKRDSSGPRGAQHLTLVYDKR